MQKTRRLMDENSVFLKCITLGSESQISVFKQCQGNTQMSGCFWFFFLGGGGMRRSQNFFSEKMNFIRRFIRFNFPRLSLAFILKYYPILHGVKR